MSSLYSQYISSSFTYKLVLVTHWYVTKLNSNKYQKFVEVTLCSNETNMSETILTCEYSTCKYVTLLTLSVPLKIIHLTNETSGLCTLNLSPIQCSLTLYHVLNAVTSSYLSNFYNTYSTKEYNSHPGFEISILKHQHQCEWEMVLQDSSTQLVTWT